MNYLDVRRAGILLHPTSLPGPADGGDLGPNAYWFIDFLVKSGISVWQTLPLGQPHGDLSPYQCQSVHAGNTRLISLELLIKAGWLNPQEESASEQETDWANYRSAALKEAFQLFRANADDETLLSYTEFLKENTVWLKDYSLFRVLKTLHEEAPWWEWAVDYRNRSSKALDTLQQRFSQELEQHNFEQFLFYHQWQSLKQYANDKDILLFGDLPIFVAADSSDVWAGRENFLVDEQGKPSVVAGVPPDYFSATGQLWGNPHYNWEYMQSNGFLWWLERLRAQQAMFDMVRIDHFRGFEAYWEIPAGEETAMNGRWVEAPGEALFKTLQLHQTIPLVAEDLGIITDEVNALREQFQIPGMKVLQFAFEGGGAENPYLPHNHVENCVIYTGTHDNNTTLGWFQESAPETQQYVCDYLGANPDAMPWPMIRSVFSSVARLSIVPMQDILGLGTAHRMNTPGVAEGNWRWRFSWDDIPNNLDQRLKSIIECYGRLPK
ncbi:4-alpha-glucanotransferase [Candidatus Venteria ishoeyi]|uniref:4-alpha-glucanotransferase n=1 Tax=Candidatus Venteria ishoeyi TaxID=1899563 RepID=A0A1H6FDY0_9GAMM|nr:4-alpha-glucanotransferase [Candidatus Venteria ishoeyi]MDM8547312.1 4-alpha-glucanotransferase [Candidatus Venteria ishoeyi]SEH07376.1 4-alpha-glucanotransferase [Candidatus Venteria ishoeyi]